MGLLITFWKHNPILFLVRVCPETGSFARTSSPVVYLTQYILSCCSCTIKAQETWGYATESSTLFSKGSFYCSNEVRERKDWKSIVKTIWIDIKKLILRFVSSVPDIVYSASYKALEVDQSFLTLSRTGFPFLNYCIWSNSTIVHWTHHLVRSECMIVYWTYHWLCWVEYQCIQFERECILS